MRDVLATEMMPVRVLKGKAQGVKMSPQWKSTEVLLHLEQILLSFCGAIFCSGAVGKMTGSAFMLTNFDGSGSHYFVCTQQGFSGLFVVSLMPTTSRRVGSGGFDCCTHTRSRTGIHVSEPHKPRDGSSA